MTVTAAVEAPLKGVVLEEAIAGKSRIPRPKGRGPIEAGFSPGRRYSYMNVSDD